jgi:hypothetical protein
MATKKRKRFSEGGTTEAEDKARGLEASKSEKVGFLERMRMGNIDEEGSEAYRRFGAGRGKAERTPVEDRVATPVTRPMPAAQAAPVAAAMDEQPKPGGRPLVDVQMPKPSAPANASVQVKPSAPVKAAPVKTAPKMQEQTYRRTSGATADDRAKVEPSKRRGTMEDIPLDAPRTPVKGEKVDSTELGRNVANTLNALPGGHVVRNMTKASAAAKTGSRELADKYDDVTFLGRSARRPVGANEALQGSKAKALEAPRKKIRGPEPKKLSRRKEDEFASGGSVSNASKRADGIATKGKTRCKMR